VQAIRVRQIGSCPILGRRFALRTGIRMTVIRMTRLATAPDRRKTVIGMTQPRTAAERGGMAA
jgi:hypothetical protein